MVYAHHFKVHNIILWFSISCCSVFSFTSRFSFPLDYLLVSISSCYFALPCDFRASRFRSTLSSSISRISFCISGDCGIIPNWSCVSATQLQSLFLLSPKSAGVFGVKIINTRIKDFGVWIGFTVVFFGNGRYICFQPDNHRKNMD